ncbi:MAG TPA: ABC transporter substrate-binding protein [Actinomycetota bacterium]
MREGGTGIGWARRPVVAALMATGLLAAACSGAGGGGGTSSAQPGVKQGGILRIGTSYPIDSMNPFVAQSDYSYMVFEYIYPQLVQYDAKLNVIPDFASSWQESSDGLTWTWHTRPNAKWSDGQPLTAADAAYTMNMIMKYADGPTGQAAPLLSHVTGAEATDPNTLVVHYSTPVANVLAQMQSLSILPEHIWSKIATGKGTAIRTYLNVPTNGQPLVSGGPFTMVKYQKEALALFQRNPNWYGAKPHIDGFGLQFFSNADAMIEAIKNGELDFVGEYTPPTAVATLEQSGFIVSTPPSISMKTFIINSSQHKTTNRELLNPLVRQALEYAVDREQIVKTAWLGYSQTGSTIIAPADGIWHNPTIHALPFDLAKANQLLDQAGYPKGSDGIRVANGHKMVYAVIFPPDEKGPGDRAFQIIQSDFRQIGIVISQRNMDDDATFEAITNPDNKYLTFDFAMWDWVPPVDPDFMLSVMTCQQLGNNSDTGYCNPSYDQMYAQQGTLTNEKQRQQLIWKMQQTIYDDRPYLILNYPDIIEAHSKQWTGFVLAPVMGSVNSLSKLTLLGVHEVG